MKNKEIPYLFALPLAQSCATGQPLHSFTGNLFMEKVCGIYKITSPTNKAYIGQSSDIKTRWRFYKTLHCKRQTYLYHSLMKYGVKAHRFEIICECMESDLNKMEKYYVDLFKTFNSNNGLNLKDGGNYSKLSDATKKKISEALKGKPRPDLRGRKFTDEHKANITKSKTGKTTKNKGRRFSEEHKLKISLSLKGKGGWKSGVPFTDEHRKNISAAKSGISTRGRGWIVSEETKTKISLAKTGVKRPPMSDETKRKMSISKTGKQSPIKGIKYSDEIKKRKSEATKLWWQKRKLKCVN